LENEGIVALPTETVYGLAGKAHSERANKRIYEAKNRPADNPLIWHVHNIEKALLLFDLSTKAEQRLKILAERFWPGPLTIVAKKNPQINSPMATIAVRIPKNEITQCILRRCDFPLAMPSANLSSRPSPTSASLVLKTLNGRIDAVMDGGVCEGGLESTVLSIDEEIKVLRYGLISSPEIEDALKEGVITETNPHTIMSPGQSYLHYAPKVRKVSLLNINDAAHFWFKNSTILGRKGDIAELLRRFGARIDGAATIVLDDQPVLFAKQLYEALYEAEQNEERDLILLAPPRREDWAAINDRLRRAAGSALNGI
ncbi:MAG TPA: L-threonylcarbamoyladenylate synthase, partial [Myxococcota bacterium]|nr:L-threonylcarbamoyladenylate synthase [Myxococcota bacterium]